MRTIVLYIFLLVCSSAFGQNAGIDFTNGTWQDAQQRAAENKKPLFIFAYSPGCQFCKKMEKTVFPDQQVSSYYNTTFTNYKLNIDDGPGAEFARQFNITGYPTYIYFDATGRLLHISGSEKTVTDFIQDGKNAFDPDKAYAALKKRYDNGDRSPDLLYNFSRTLIFSNISGNLLDTVTGEYLATQSVAMLQSEKNLRLIFDQPLMNFDAPVTSYYFRFQQAMTNLFGEAAVEKKSHYMIGVVADQAGANKDSARIKQIRDLLKSYPSKNREQLTAFANFKYLLGNFRIRKKEWKPYAEAALTYGSKYAGNDNFALRESATYLYYFANNPAAFELASQVMDQAIAPNKSYDNLLLQAKILHKLGHDQRALIAADEAVRIAAVKEEDNAEAITLEKEIRNPKSK